MLETDQSQSATTTTRTITSQEVVNFVLTDHNVLNSGIQASGRSTPDPIVAFTIRHPDAIPPQPNAGTTPMDTTDQKNESLDKKSGLQTKIKYVLRHLFFL